MNDTFFELSIISLHNIKGSLWESYTKVDLAISSMWKYKHTLRVVKKKLPSFEKEITDDKQTMEIHLFKGKNRV